MVPVIRTGVLLLLLEELVDLVTNLARRDLDVVLGGAVVVHEGKEVVVSDVELCASEVSHLPRFFAPTRVFLTSWYSRRETFGTSMLWVDGDRSSSFLPVKMSMAVKWTLA